MLLWPMRLLHMAQLPPWGQDNRVQVAGLTAFGQRKALCKKTGKELVLSEPFHSWASLRWEGNQRRHRGLCSMHCTLSVTLICLAVVKYQVSSTWKERTKKHVLLSVKSIFWKCFLKPAEIPSVNSLKPGSTLLKLSELGDSSRCLKTFYWNILSRIWWRNNIQNQKEKTELFRFRGATVEPQRSWCFLQDPRGDISYDIPNWASNAAPRVTHGGCVTESPCPQEGSLGVWDEIFQFLAKSCT